MKPIRKDEQEYLREYIKDKFRDKRSALESDREIDVEEQAKKNYKKFVSTLKVTSMIKEAEKLQKDYDNFCNNKQIIEDQKRKKVKNAIQKIEDHLKKWADTPSFTRYDSDRVETEVVDRYINKMLQHETRKAYDNSNKGKAIKELDAQRESCENALYSGSSLGSVRQYIHSVLTKAQIQDSIPNNLMIENK